MPELPWVKWYPQNWSSEPGLSLCDAATRGIWIDAINAMMLTRNGKIVGSLEALSRLCRCRPAQMQVALLEIAQYDIGTVAHQQDGNIIVTCRRIDRELAIKGLRSKAGRISATKRQHTPQHPSTYTSTYTSPEIDTLPEPDTGGENGNGSEVPTLAMCREYGANPACAFPPELVEEWFNKSSDRGWGKDWRARMRGASATYRAIRDERRAKEVRTGGGPRPAKKHAI
jgi:hypothetical protein